MLYGIWFEELNGELVQMVEIYADSGVCPDVIKDMVPVMLNDTDFIKQCYESGLSIEDTCDKLYGKHIMQVSV